MNQHPQSRVMAVADAQNGIVSGLTAERPLIDGSASARTIPKSGPSSMPGVRLPYHGQGRFMLMGEEVDFSAQFKPENL
jgi:hypothetical protein